MKRKFKMAAILAGLLSLSANFNTSAMSSPSAAAAKNFTMPEKQKRGQSTPQSLLVFNADTGEIYSEKNPHEVKITASLNKAMTMYLFFEHISQKGGVEGRAITVSHYAVRHARGGNVSRLNLRKDDKISYDTALRAMTVKSANDVAFAIAQEVSGTHKDFVTLMNQRAQEWGMNNTFFYDASGLSRPHSSRKNDRTFSISTACDLAILNMRLVNDYPALYQEYFGAKSFSYKEKTYNIGRSSFLNIYENSVGQKTGYLSRARNNIITTVSINGQRIGGVALAGYWRPDTNKALISAFDSALENPQAQENKPNMCTLPNDQNDTYSDNTSYAQLNK